MLISKLKVIPSMVLSEGTPVEVGADELPDPDARVAERETDPVAEPLADPETWTLLVLD